MNKKFVVPIITMIGIMSFVVLGASPVFFENILEFAQNHSIISEDFSSRQESNLIKPSEKVAADSSDPSIVSQNEKSIEVPETILWHMVFKMNETIEKEAQKLLDDGKDGRIWSEYFIRQAGLSHEQMDVLKEKSIAYLEEIKPIDERAKSITQKIRSQFPDGRVADGTEVPQAPVELQELQTRKDQTVLYYRDSLRASMGESAFNNFKTALKSDFAKGITLIAQPTPRNTDNGGDGQ